MPFEVTLTDEERDAWIERAAHEVVRRRMEVPAVFMLEMHRPLSFLGSQALIVATPFLGALAGTDNVLKLSKLLEDSRNVERLVNRIEELAAESQAQSLEDPEHSDSAEPAAGMESLPTPDEEGTAPLPEQQPGRRDETHPESG